MEIGNLQEFYDKYGKYNILVDRLNIPSYSVAYSWSKTKKIIQNLSLKIIIEKLSKNKNIKILDIGCGDGGDLIRLAILSKDKNIEFVGTELSRPFIDFANRAAKIKGLNNCKFIYDDIEKSKLSDQYDLILTSEVLEHLKNPQKAILNIGSLINKEGFLIVTTPNSKNILKYPFLFLKKTIAKKNIESMTKTLRSNEKHFKTEEQHLFVFSSGQLKEGLAKAGFKNVKQFRGSLTFGGGWFDSKPAIFSLIVLFDKILDLTPFKNTSWDLIFLARKEK